MAKTLLPKSTQNKPIIRIALFSHKGGVSKTTTAFHLGWMLAKNGHRVVLVDADPQCNLSGLVLACRKITGVIPFDVEPERKVSDHSHVVLPTCRALAAGLPYSTCCHTWRATGITEYLKNGSTLEKAQAIANHESARTTKLYDRRSDDI